MRTVIEFCQRPLVLMIALPVVIACMVGFRYLVEALGGVGILDSLYGYDREVVEQKMLAYGEAGRALYAYATLTLDIVYPVAYACLYAGLLARLAHNTRYGWSAYLPLLAGFVDVVENVQIHFLLTGYPNLPAMLPDWQIASASFTTQAKWVLIAATGGALLVLGAYRLVRWLRERRGSRFTQSPNHSSDDDQQ